MLATSSSIHSIGGASAFPCQLCRAATAKVAAWISASNATTNGAASLWCWLDAVT
jgi:hypothetical protein